MSLALPPLLMAAALVLAPQGSLACADPLLRSESPDGGHVLTVCRRSSWRPAMPGQGSDGQGWAVLRDRAGHIAGVVDIGTLLELGHAPEWEPDHAAIPLVARIGTFPAEMPAYRRVMRDRAVRVAAHLGLAPGSEAFR